MNLSVVFIGAGNLATRLSLQLKAKGHNIVQVYSRTEQSAVTLAHLLNCDYTTHPGNIVDSADLYFVAINDDAYHQVLPKIALKDNLLVHVAGSVPMHILAPYSCNIGVFYPLQTFSKDRNVSFEEVPIFVEAEKVDNENKLRALATQLSKKVSVAGSEERKTLHLAAVFCCNFVNHMYTLAAEMIEEKGLDFELLKPLIRETAAKIEEMHPRQAQTGPALRYDKSVINRHFAMLEDDLIKREIYRMITDSIYETQTPG